MSYKSGTKFRSRKIDNKRPLAVYRSSELQDLNELTNLSRAAPMVATGVEKEEEEEYHLQNALHSTQSGVAHHTTFIPTPDASRLINNYKDFYNKPFHQPKSLIRHSIPMEEAIGCLYNMDEQDDIFFAEYTKELKEGKIKEEAKINEDQFEEVMYALENLTNQKFGDELSTLEELQEYMNTQLHPPPSECYHYIYEYWKKRRLQRNKKPIQPYLKTEELKIDSDPYVCFRRREIKTLRKTRRCDALSLEKLKRLQVEMEQAHELMEMVCKREKLRRDSLLLEHKIFEQKILIRQMKKKLGVVSFEKVQNEMESNSAISSISENPANKISSANVNSSISVNVPGTQANVNSINSGSGHTRVRKKMRKSNVHHNGDEPSSKRLTLPKIKIRQSSVLHSDYEGGRTTAEKVAQVEANTRSSKKAEEEKTGWIDLMDLPDPTEDLPYIHQGNTFYQSDLPMTIDYKTFSLRCNQSLPFARRRIGRGGRIIFDRRVSLQKIREIKKLHKHSIGLLGQPGTYESKFHNHGGKGKSRPKLPWLKNAYPQRHESVDYQWFDECSDLDDFESEEDIREDNNSLAYNSKIYTETDQMVLQVKPAFPEQFNPFITMKRPAMSNNNNTSKTMNTSSSHLPSSSTTLQNTEVTTASTTAATLASSKSSISNLPNNNNLSPTSSLSNTQTSSIAQLSSTQSPISNKITTPLTNATLTTAIPSRSSTPTIKGSNIVTTTVSSTTTPATITTIDTPSTKANTSSTLLNNPHLSPISKVNDINLISTNPTTVIPTSNMEISSSIHHSGSLSNKSHISTPTMTAGSPLNIANSKITNSAINALKSTISNDKFTSSLNTQASPTSVSTKTMPNGLAANTLQVNALNNAAIASSLNNTNKVTGPSVAANNKNISDLMANSKTMASPKVVPTLKNSNINSMNVSPLSTVGAMNAINVMNKMKLGQGYTSSPVNEANLAVEGLKNQAYLAQAQAQAKNQRISSPYSATAKAASLNPYMSNINANVLANAKLNNYYNNATAAIAAAKAGSSFALTSSTVANTTSTAPTTTTNTTSTIGITSKTTAATTLIQTPTIKASLQPTTVSTTTTPLMNPNTVNPLSGANPTASSEIMLGSSPISTPNSVKSTARKTIRKDTPTMNATTTLKSAQTTPTSKPTIDDPKTIALRHFMQAQAQAQKNAQLQQQLSQQNVLASEAAAVSHIHTGNVAAAAGNQNAVGVLNNVNVTAASTLNGAHTTSHVNHGNSINISNLPANATELNPAAAIASQSSPMISTANAHLPQNLQNVLLNSQQANLIHEGNMNVFAGAGLSPQKNLSNIALVNNLAAQRQQQQNKILMTNAVNQGVVGLNQASLLQNQAIQNPLTQQQRIMQLRLQQQLRNVVPNTMNSITQQQALLYRQQQQQQQLLLNALQRQNMNKMNAMPMMMGNPNALPKGVAPSASPPRQFVQPAFLPQYQQAQHQRNLMLMQQQLKMMNNKQFAEQVNGGLGNNAALMMSNGLFNGLGGIPASTANQILINQQRAALVNSKEELAKATALNGIIDDKTGANVLLNEVAASQAAAISKKL